MRFGLLYKQVMSSFLFVMVITANGFAQEFAPGEVIVKLKGKISSSSTSQFMGKMMSKAGGTVSLKNSFHSLNMHRFAFKNQDVNSMMSELVNDPAVEYVEPNYIYKKADAVPMDLNKYSLDQLQTSSASDQYTQSNAHTNVQQTWGVISVGQNFEKPIVAIVDTGLDYNHKVFKDSGAVWVNTAELNGRAGVDDDGNGYIDDIRGWNFWASNNNPMDDDEHGTHVAGIVLGVSQDIMKTTLDPAIIQIMPLKFLGADGSGTTADAIAAIYYAVNNGASVINNSWGGSSYSQSLHDALAYAYEHKVLIVTAAGNYGKNNDSNPMYPANYPVPSQISVAATTDTDYLASFSNYGSQSVHVGSPGVAILSTIPDGLFRYMSGTSMAAPFVAGMAALSIREANHLSGYQIKNIILNSSASVGNLRSKVITEARVDSYLAVVSSKAEVNTQSSQPTYNGASSSNSSSASRETASTSKGGCGLVKSTGNKLPFGPQDGDAAKSNSNSSNNGKGSGLSALLERLGLSAESFGMLFSFSLLPIILWQVLRRRKDNPANRRTHERFLMDSAIKINVGGRELTGQMKTISLGGASFCLDAMLEKGGSVTMMINSPNGDEQVQVQGQVVWNESNQSFGVKFDQAKDNVQQQIQSWTKDLNKAAS